MYSFKICYVFYIFINSEPFFYFFVKQISWQKLVESVKMSKFQLGRDSLNDRSLYDQRI